MGIIAIWRGFKMDHGYGARRRDSIKDYCIFSSIEYIFRWPLLAGRVLAILGSILYILVEVFPTNRRYVMMTCYIIFSIASSLFFLYFFNTKYLYLNK